MTPLARPTTIFLARRGPAVWAGVLAAGTCLLAAGCSSGSPATASGASADRAGHMAALAPQAGPAAPGASGMLGIHGKGARLSSRSPSLTALAPPAIIHTASLTVRVANVQAAASRATHIAALAGGYVATEQTALSRERSVQSVINIQFKVPATAYQATLTALAGLGTRLSESQQAQDVTQTVADVSSRVASAQAAIAQLRRLLTRTGSVSGLLSVQDQINQEEASLEALQSQQRALAGETTFATISMVIVSTLPAHHQHHHAKKKAAGGFVGGLTAGWHALGTVAGAVFTATGAVLPFAIVLALLALAVYAARRRLARRKAGPGPAAGASTAP
jgi:Domain of unknown function (DUF4349)